MRQFSTKRLFLSFCVCSFFLVLFLYLYGTKILEKTSRSSTTFAGGRTALRYELFKNVTSGKPVRTPDICTRRTSIPSSFTSLVFVLSEPHHARRRQIIRTTWADKKLNFLLGSSVIFVVPVPDIESHRKHRTQLRLETEVFSDVIVSHTNDVEMKEDSISASVIKAAKWSTQDCQSVDFIVFLTDETFVNPFALERLLGDIVKHRSSTSSVSGTTKLSMRNINSHNLIIQTDSYNQQQVRDLKRYVETTRRRDEFIKPTSHVIHEIDESHLATTPITISTEIHQNAIYCLVWRNITEGDSIAHEMNIESSKNVPYCSPHGFVLESKTAEILVSVADQTARSNSRFSLGQSGYFFYVTGVLALKANIGLEVIKDRFAFELGEVDERAVFIPLGSDIEGLCGSLWKMTVDNEQDAGTFGFPQN